MNIGLGTTVLMKGESSGHLDGIAVYTKHLREKIPAPDTNLSSFAFLLQQKNSQTRSLGRFSHQGIVSAVTGLPFYSTKQMEKEIDLFHATDHYIPKLSTIPVVATIMDPIPLAHPEWVSGNYRQLKNIFFKRMAKWADHIITISDYSANAIEEYFHIPKSNISVIPLGVDEQCFNRIPEQEKQAVLSRYNLPENYFIFIGTLQPRKNVERLLKAFLKLPESIQRAHPLVIVGRDGWMCEQLVEQLNQAKAKLSRTVYWLDYVSFTDKYALLQSSLALVFPSLYEGFGLPVLEAFASDVPVITSTVTSLPEVAGDAAILIDPYSTDDISQAMLDIASDSTLHAQLKKRGRQRVKTFSWQNTAEKTTDIYTQNT